MSIALNRAVLPDDRIDGCELAAAQHRDNQILCNTSQFFCKHLGVYDSVSNYFRYTIQCDVYVMNPTGGTVDTANFKQQPKIFVEASSLFFVF